MEAVVRRRRRRRKQEQQKRKRKRKKYAEKKREENDNTTFGRHVHAVKKVRRKREVSTCRALVYKSGTGCRDTDLTNHKSRIMATYSSIPVRERTKAEISQLRYAY